MESRCTLLRQLFFAGLYLSRLEAKMVGDSEGRSASTLMRVGEFHRGQFLKHSTIVSPGGVIGLAEGFFIFLSSLVVIVHILTGGAVAADLRKIIRIKDFIFSSLFMGLLLVRYLVIPKDQWYVFDCHLWSLLGNAKLVEYLLLNKNATAYWSKIFNRWKTNRVSNWAPGGPRNNNSTSVSIVSNITVGNHEGEGKERRERKVAWPDNAPSRF